MERPQRYIAKKNKKSIDKFGSNLKGKKFFLGCKTNQTKENELIEALYSVQMSINFLPYRIGWPKRILSFFSLSRFYVFYLEKDIIWILTRNFKRTPKWFQWFFCLTEVSIFAMNALWNVLTRFCNFTTPTKKKRA